MSEEIKFSLAEQAVIDAEKAGMDKAKEYTEFGRKRGIRRAEMRAARKRLGFMSVKLGDAWIWIPPEEEQCENEK